MNRNMPPRRAHTQAQVTAALLSIGELHPKGYHPTSYTINCLDKLRIAGASRGIRVFPNLVGFHRTQGRNYATYKHVRERNPISKQMHMHAYRTLTWQSEDEMRERGIPDHRYNDWQLAPKEIRYAYLQADFALIGDFVRYIKDHAPEARFWICMRSIAVAQVGINGPGNSQGDRHADVVIIVRNDDGTRDVYHWDPNAPDREQQILASGESRVRTFTSNWLGAWMLGRSDDPKERFAFSAFYFNSNGPNRDALACIRSSCEFILRLIQSPEATMAGEKWFKASR
jgi:hypothetical protein